MEQKVKNYLGIAIIIGILVFAYAAWSYVGTYSKSAEPSSFRSFSVSGEGKVVTVPDVAAFTFSVVTEGGRNLSQLQKENIGRVNKAIAFVKDNKVDQKDVKTEGYNINPRYQYYECDRQVQIYSPILEPTPCPPPEIVGYTITQTVGVKVRDFSRVGDIVAGVVLNGANSVSGLSFTIDDRTKAENDAREEAISKAEEKARATARAGGFGIGKLLSIEEGFQPYYEYGRGGGMESMSLKSAAPAPTIEPGSQEVRITVTLRYEIE